MTELNWLYATCPYCGEDYPYLIIYKPTTCGKFDCNHRHLHPELYDGTRPPSIAGLVEKQRMENKI